MAPTKGRVAEPERRWDCRRGIPGRRDNTVGYYSRGSLHSQTISDKLASFVVNRDT